MHIRLHHPAVFHSLVFFLLINCSSAENRNDRNTDTTGPSDVKTNTEEDIQDDLEDTNKDTNEVEDINEESPNSSLQNVRSEALEGMVNLGVDLVFIRHECQGVAA